MPDPHGAIRTLPATSLALAALLLAAGPALAQDPIELDLNPDPNTGRVSLDLGFDVTSHYIFRGFPQENQGFIIQPWAEVGFNLHEGEEWLNSIDLYLGNWNSFHSNQTLAESSPGTWYEADLYAGLSFGLFDDWTFDVLYTAYTSPSGAFDSIQEIGLIIAYDDSAWWADQPGVWGTFSLDPYAAFYFETQNRDAAVHHPDSKYFEAGLAPNLTFHEEGDWPITVAVPMTVGLDMDAYYGSNTFGFFDVGLVASVPLRFIPADFGAWEASAGVHYIRLGNQAAAAGAPDITDGSKDFIYGVFGLTMSY